MSAETAGPIAAPANPADPATPADRAATPPRHVYLIDGSGFIFRAYHALPWLSRSDGTPVNAVLGFVNMLLKLVGETDADHIAVVFDSSRTTFRTDIYDQYKAHRPDAPDDLKPQFGLVREATEAFGITKIEKEGYEADDLIATYAREAAEAGAVVTIVSSDKDLMQLVNDKVTMLDPIKNKSIGPDEVHEKFGVGPEKVIDVQALCGDTVDNVPGVQGIGVKTAADLINAYGSLEALLDRAGEIKQAKRRETLLDPLNQERARLSKQLVTLVDHVPLPCPLSALALKPIDTERLAAFCRAQDFRKVVQRIEAGAFRMKGAPAGAAVGASAPSATPAPAAHEPKHDAFVTGNYALIQDEAALERWIARAQEAGMAALHVETCAPEAALAAVVGIGIAVPSWGGEKQGAAYLPLGHVAPGAGTLDAGAAPQQIASEKAVAALGRLAEDASVLKVGHNFKFVAEVLAELGIDRVASYDCTMLISYVLDGAQHGHALDELAARHLGHEPIPYKSLCGTGKSQTGFDAVPVEKARDYAAEAAELTLGLHRVLKPKLPRERMTGFYETIERPLPPIVADMERAGIKVDRDELHRLSEDFSGRLAALEREIFELAGHEFTIGSPKQLGEVLFDELGLPGGKKGKTGAYSTDVTVLEQLALTHDLPRKVLDWRQIAKLKATYTDALLSLMRPGTGRVHTTLQLAATSTGRLSSTDPNLQNIPIRTEEGRKIRRVFVAEPGHVLLSADYSQIELRLAAHMADLETLKESFRRGEDIHARTASEVFGVPIDQVDGNVRRYAKTINFGILYGISAFGLAQRLQMPQNVAGDYIRAYFARFPGIRDYMERTKLTAREAGYVETLFGRKCYIPGIRDGNVMRRQGAERQAINAPLQGTAADIIKRAMNRMPGRLRDAGLKTRMLLQVHDELLFEAPEDEAERAAPIIREVMEDACAPRLTLSVPLVAETGWAKNWEEAH